MALAGTSLEACFGERGVPLLELASGQRAPRTFGDPVAEHLATRRAAGLFDFSFMACVELRGRESPTLLDAIQPRNLALLPVGRIRYTLLLRHDGTVLNDATVWRTTETSYLLFVGRRSDIGFLEHHAARLEVELDDRSDELAVLAVQGPRSRDVLRRCLSMPHELAYFSFAEAEFMRYRCLVANIGYTGEAGFEIVIAAELAAALWAAACKAGEPDGLRECGFIAADTLRIEAGHVLFSNELALPVTPYELGLARLIDHYRESSSAMRALGSERWREPQRRLAGLLLDSLGSRGAHERRPGTAAAVPTSACRSPLLGRTIALGFVAGADRYPGTRVAIDSHQGATVVRLPFYDPGKQRSRSLA